MKRADKLYAGRGAGEHDATTESSDGKPWYRVDVSLVHSAALRDSFVLCTDRGETADYMARCKLVADSFWRQAYHRVAGSMLRLACTDTTTNALLQRGTMFLLTQQNLKEIFAADKEKPRAHAIIDLGAGDGTMAAELRRFFDAANVQFYSGGDEEGDKEQTDSERASLGTEVYATEASPGNRMRLREKAIRVLPDLTEAWQRPAGEGGVKADLIACLNLLDRHPKPMTLLGEIRRKAAADGAPVLLAIVLPYLQLSEFDADGVRETMDLAPFVGDDETFERLAAVFYEEILVPAGFRVIRWTKLPYLYEGDSAHPFYTLFDAVFLLKAE